MIATQANFRTVANCAFIDLPSATQQGYMRDSGIFVAPDPVKRVEDAAACIGTVVSVPERGITLILHEGQPNEQRIPIPIKAGDKVAVDYRVVGKGNWEGDRFAHEGAWLIDDEIVWKAEPYSLIAVWRDVGVFDSDMILDMVDECSLSDRWKSNKECKPISKDAYDGRKGYWQALGEHVLLEKVTELDHTYQKSTLIMPEIMHKEVPGRGRHVSGLDLPVGTELVFDHRFGSVYQFTDGREYIVTMRDHILGTIN